MPTLFFWGYSMQIRWPFQILVLVVLVLGIYFPTLEAEVSIVDDIDAITGFYNAEPLSAKEIFIPRQADGGYYRPLIGISYLVDKHLWDMDRRSMHLDNIVMHLINVLIVYVLVILVTEKTKNSWLAFAFATLFALHPIATESVNWISGRTDIMAANFVLTATILLVLYRKMHTWWLFLGAMLLILLGALAKEVAFGMIPATAILLFAQDDPTLYSNDEGALCQPELKSATIGGIFCGILMIMVMLYVGNSWIVLATAAGYAIYLHKPWHHLAGRRNTMLKLGCSIAAGFVISAMLYLFFRKLAFTSDVSKLGQTLHLMFEDTGYTISVFMGAAGFYIKKFFLPLPLNFYILEIDPLYDLLGVVLLLFCIFLTSRLTLSASFFLAGICMFIPALPFALGTIAWTGYAERYIYLSSAFWIIALAIYLQRFATSRHQIVRFSFASVVCLLILFNGWHTFHRNFIWQKNTTLLADTVAQSPQRPVIREMYMQALIGEGNYNLAKEQYRIGKSKGIFYTEGPELLMATIAIKEGNQDTALAIYDNVLSNSGYKSERALKAAVVLINQMAANKTQTMQQLIEKRAHYLDLLLKVSRDPMFFYTMGQKAISSGDHASAISFFERAYNLFPDNNPYRGYAAQILKKLCIPSR